MWEVTPEDEKAFNRYEEYPRFYRKQDFKVVCKGIRTKRRRTVDTFAYVMDGDRPVSVPSDFYMGTCLEGYGTFFFDRNILIGAYERSLEEAANEG